MWMWTISRREFWASHLCNYLFSCLHARWNRPDYIAFRYVYTPSLAIQELLHRSATEGKASLVLQYDTHSAMLPQPARDLP